jgi:hypothetical protein
MLICRKTLLRNIAVALLIACAWTSLVHGQDSPTNARGTYDWLNAGLGWGPYPMSAGLSFSHQWGHYIMSIRGVYSEELVFTIPWWGQTETITNYIYDVGLLVGYSTKTPQSLGYFSIAAGVSYVAGDPHGSAIGLPIEAQLFYTPFSFLGFGVTGFADINGEKRFAGVLICVQVGKLR